MGDVNMRRYLALRASGYSPSEARQVMAEVGWTNPPPKAHALPPGYLRASIDAHELIDNLHDQIDRDIIMVSNPVRDGRVVTRPGETEDAAWRRYHVDVEAKRRETAGERFARHLNEREARRYPSESWPVTAVDEVDWPGLRVEDVDRAVRRVVWRQRAARRRRWPSVPRQWLFTFNGFQLIVWLLTGVLVGLRGSPNHDPASWLWLSTFVAFCAAASPFIGRAFRGCW